MKFSFNTRRVGGVVVMDLSGRMVTREPLDQLSAAIQGALESGSRQFAFNMREVEAMDSSGLAILRDCVVGIKERQGILKLFATSNRIMTLLRITQFVRILETFDDEQTAIATFNAP
jgi:anti-anti-sigma factor